MLKLEVESWNVKNFQNTQNAGPTPPGGRKLGMEVAQDPSVQRGFNFHDFELIKVIGRGSYAKVILKLADLKANAIISCYQNYWNCRSASNCKFDAESVKSVQVNRDKCAGLGPEFQVLPGWKNLKQRHFLGFIWCKIITFSVSSLKTIRLILY